MRRKFNPQMTLFSPMARNTIVKELEQISRILDANPRLMDLLFEDLVATRRPDTGREGMSAEQVLRCAVLKQYRQLTYEELAFHLEDSDAFRSFSRLEMQQYPSKSILQENIKAIREETWEAIHREVVSFAIREEMETGRKVRVDSTVVETDIHHPTDSTLLADGVRIITRWLTEGKELAPPAAIPVRQPPASREEESHDDPQRTEGYHTRESLPGPSALCRTDKGLCGKR